MIEPDTTLRIKSIKVTGLFGLYDHDVTLKEDRVTVIHGPNGVGKTVFLKLTNAFLRGSYHEIITVPFESFEIHFADNSIARIQVEREPNNSRKIHLIFKNSEGVATDKSTIDSEQLGPKRFSEQILDSLPFLVQMGPNEWLDRRTEEVIGSDDLVALVNEYAPKLAKKWVVREPKELREFRQRINVHLIEAQRLIRLTNVSGDWRYRPNRERPTTNTVQEYSRDLKRKLESTLATYAKHSQKLDQTFPQRLLQGIVDPLTIDQLKVELQQVEATRERLKKIGILDGGESTQDTYPLQISKLDGMQSGQLPVMSVYARDTKQKLAVLAELSERIEILLDVLNRKFTNKQVTISRESGIAIFGKDGNPIPITALSSGEQHELVLLYDLLFKVKPNTLVLIDEPELSLHISWQKGFMDDLLEIIRLAHFDVLIATHSPYIVGDHSDLLVILSSES
ncbi:AAA family ATPase [Methylomonas rivi]|uniref:AAA family ATPase n=1 Tax=Methylomonas rivi TaxID=2952226 RepID=A0ABT1UAF4_9GAMM|nr:AAA family ATPase [Methylomonas sp. WSC-6]